MDKSDASSIGLGACDYFHAICQQSLPGPLVGGNVGSREVNKWVDEKIASCESPDKDYRRGELLRLLFSLLKIGCQHRGKFRSPFGTDQSLKVKKFHLAYVCFLVSVAFTLSCLFYFSEHIGG